MDANADPAKRFREILAALAGAVESAARAAGLEVDGEIRGVVREAGRPESGTGFATPVGAGLPPGWRRAAEHAGTTDELAEAVADADDAMDDARADRESGYRGDLPAERLADHVRALAAEVGRLRNDADEKRVRLHVADLVRKCETLIADNAALRARLAEEEAAHDVTIRQRDFAEEWADKLASGVGDIEVIGEHSNLNNPWETAYGLMRSLAEFEAAVAELAALRARVADLEAGLRVAVALNRLRDLRDTGTEWMSKEHRADHDRRLADAEREFREARQQAAAEGNP